MAEASLLSAMRSWRWRMAISRRWSSRACDERSFTHEIKTIGGVRTHRGSPNAQSSGGVANPGHIDTTATLVIGSPGRPAPHPAPPPLIAQHLYFNKHTGERTRHEPRNRFGKCERHMSDLRDGKAGMIRLLTAITRIRANLIATFLGGRTAAVGRELCPSTKRSKPMSHRVPCWNRTQVAVLRGGAPGPGRADRPRLRQREPTLI